MGLERFSDLWGYAVPLLMPEVQGQGVIPDQEGYGGSHSARTVEIRFRDAYAHQTCLCKGTRDGVNSEEDPTGATSATTREGPDIGPTVGNVQTRYRGPGTKGN